MSLKRSAPGLTEPNKAGMLQAKCHRRPSSRASFAILEFWLKGGWGLADFGNKEQGSQISDNKKCRGYVNFEVKL